MNQTLHSILVFISIVIFLYCYQMSRDEGQVSSQDRGGQLTKCQGLTATPSSGCAAPLVACATLAVEILVSQLPV